jgi:4-amino-4-deoxy-L-arabinose transferase-like glycosyltransferase
VAGAKLFGYSGLSLILPQALAGVLSVAVLYRLVSHTFGVGAGQNAQSRPFAALQRIACFFHAYYVVMFGPACGLWPRLIRAQEAA